MEEKFQIYKRKRLRNLVGFKYFADWKANEYLHFLIFLSFEFGNHLKANWKDCLTFFLDFLEYSLRPYILRSEWKKGKLYEEGIYMKYKRFFDKFKILVINSNLSEYEQKVTLHAATHLYECLCYGPFPLIWAKKYEHKIADLKSGNISGPKGIAAMANMDCRKAAIQKAFRDYDSERYFEYTKCTVNDFVCLEIDNKIKYERV